MLNSDNVTFHRMLANDGIRMAAYRSAIQAAVRPGDVVLDIGTGSGILAIFACQAGAARVYAVDDGAIVTVARQLAEANGYGDRITFLNSDFRVTRLPEPVDVIVSELISRGGVGQRAEELISEARQSYLKPGGRIVPQRLELFAAPVEAPEVYGSLRFPAAEAFGIDFTLASELALCQPASTRLQPHQFLGEPASLVEIDYHTVDPIHEYRAQVDLAINRAGLLHGLVVWFDAELSPGIHLSNVPPGLPAWTNAFYPLPRPVAVSAADRVKFRWRALHPPGAGTHWQWTTTITTPENEGETPQVVATFKQTSLAGLLTSRAFNAAGADAGAVAGTPAR